MFPRIRGYACMAAVAGGIVLSAGVLAAPDVAPHEFRRVGPTLACATPGQPDESPVIRDCLRMGRLRIGMSLFDVSRELGKPYRVVEQDGATLRVYVIAIEVPEGHSLPYWVVGFRGGTVSSLQITGERGDKRVAFSSIRLGDPKSRVLDVLGEPFVTKDVKDVDAEFWGYPPFPVSFEIKNGRVYSIRISDEPDR